MTGTADRSQTGLDRLLLFVVAVVALVFLVPHVLGFVGVDVRGPSGGVAPPSDHDVTVLAARGEAIDGQRSSIGTVRLTVVPNHGRTPVNLRDVTALWVGDDVYHLAPDGTDTGGVDGTVAVSSTDGGTVLADPSDRGVLRFDLGSDDVDGATEVGRRLETSETATVTLVTERGEHLTRELTVPGEIPPGQDEVPL